MEDGFPHYRPPLKERVGFQEENQNEIEDKLKEAKEKRRKNLEEEKEHLPLGDFLQIEESEFMHPDIRISAVSAV